MNFRLVVSAGAGVFETDLVSVEHHSSTSAIDPRILESIRLLYAVFDLMWSA